MPVGGKGGVTLSKIYPHCNSFPQEDNIWWVSIGHGDSNNRKKRHCSWWVRGCVEANMKWRVPNRILVMQLGTNEDEATVFRAHAVPQGLCENFINALKLPGEPTERW